MNNAQRVLAAEYLIALGFSSWAAVKSKQMPWPPTVIRTSLAFAVLGILATASDKLAVALGAGFLLAQLIKVLEGKEPYTGGAPKLVDHGKAVPPGAYTDPQGGQHGVIGVLAWN